MATFTLMRIAAASRLTQTAGPLLLRHVKTPLAAGATQSKTLMVAPRRDARIYGPADVGPAATGHWKLERGVAMSLIPIIPVAFLFPSTALDYLVSSAVVLHIHWSLKGVTTDYVHGQYLVPFVKPTLLIMSMAAFGGLCYLNYNDIGIVRAVIKFFTEL